MQCDIIHRRSDVPIELVFFLMGAGFEVDLIEVTGDRRPDDGGEGVAIFAVSTITRSDLDMLMTLAERRPFLMARRIPASMRVEVLNAGAAECLEFPAQLAELAIRLRRDARERAEARAARATAHFACGDVLFDVNARTLTHADGRRVALTPMECRLLALLAESANSPVSRDRIDAELGRLPTRGISRAIDVTVSAVRQRLKSVDAPCVINTVRNRGYVMDGAWRTTRPPAPSPRGGADAT